MKFGFACEGVTDQATLENILCGYFADPDLDEDITRLQPLYDATDQKQKNHGGWELLLAYLKSNRFRDDALNTEHVILQIDSDDSEHQNFGVAHQDDNNLALTAEKLIENISIHLISVINSGEPGFYETHQHKFVFAISVHSLECWLYAYYNKQLLTNPKITGCYKALQHLCATKKLGNKTKIEKTYHCYDQLSRIFLKRNNIETVSQKDPSFKYFIQKLEALA